VKGGEIFFFPPENQIMTFEKNSCSIQQASNYKKGLMRVGRFCEILDNSIVRKGETIMKRTAFIPFFAGLVIAAAVLLSPFKGTAGVNVNVGINVPLPAVEIDARPAVVLIPGTYAYYVPDVDTDIIFYHDYWYRPYSGRWYRSTGYNGPWAFVSVNRVPAPLLHLPPGYRHMRPGHERIPYGQLKKNWRSWERERHWDRHEMDREAREFRKAEKEHWKEEKQEAKRERKGHARY
jgi:hypothetical protein